MNLDSDAYLANGQRVVYDETLKLKNVARLKFRRATFFNFPMFLIVFATNVLFLSQRQIVPFQEK